MTKSRVASSTLLVFIMHVLSSSSAIRLSKSGFSVDRWTKDVIAQAASSLHPSARAIMIDRKTETSYTGKFQYGGARYNIKDEGVYCCALCSLPLFKSEHKFVSGTGWPSWYDVYDHDHIEKLISVENRGFTEVVCARDGMHLGHAYPDKPPPVLQRTLQEEGVIYEPYCFVRYCINAGALRFVPAHLVGTIASS